MRHIHIHEYETFARVMIETQPTDLIARKINRKIAVIDNVQFGDLPIVWLAEIARRRLRA
jgi:hypothetical protein